MKRIILIGFCITFLLTACGGEQVKQEQICDKQYEPVNVMYNDFENGSFYGIHGIECCKNSGNDFYTPQENLSEHCNSNSPKFDIKVCLTERWNGTI